MAISARLSSAASPPGQPPISKTVRGMVIDHGHGLMVLQTELGGERVLEELEDDPLPEDLLTPLFTSTQRAYVTLLAVYSRQAEVRSRYSPRLIDTRPKRMFAT